jgi:hypothetical protein
MNMKDQPTPIEANYRHVFRPVNDLSVPSTINIRSKTLLTQFLPEKDINIFSVFSFIFEKGYLFSH